MMFLAINNLFQKPACFGLAMTEDGNNLPFRYSVTPRAKVNVFEPKALDSATDLTQCRYSTMGAAFTGSLHKLACAPNSLCKILWEAG